MEEALGDFAAPGIGTGAEELVVAGVTPVEVEEVGVPGAHGGGEAVLTPAAEGLAFEAHDAGDGGAGRVVEVPGELTEGGEQIPEEIEKGGAFVEMARRFDSPCKSSGC